MAVGGNWCGSGSAYSRLNIGQKRTSQGIDSANIQMWDSDLQREHLQLFTLSEGPESCEETACGCTE